MSILLCLSPLKEQLFQTIIVKNSREESAIPQGKTGAKFSPKCYFIVYNFTNSSMKVAFIFLSAVIQHHIVTIDLEHAINVCLALYITNSMPNIWILILHFKN